MFLTLCYWLPAQQYRWRHTVGPLASLRRGPGSSLAFSSRDEGRQLAGDGCGDDRRTIALPGQRPGLPASSRRARLLPALVMLPRLMVSPVVRSDGVWPINAINLRGFSKRERSPISALSDAAPSPLRRRMIEDMTIRTAAAQIEIQAFAGGSDQR